MIITQHHHHNGQLQRSEVEHEGRFYLRVQATFEPVIGYLEDLSPAHWYWRDGADLVRVNIGVELEPLFINELIRLNTKPSRQPSNT